MDERILLNGGMKEGEKHKPFSSLRWKSWSTYFLFSSFQVESGKNVNIMKKK